ncbi:hypothetical protein CDAR_459261 [Caerostris darwini]|uniref:Uncharacterized protein n=1 Tax=Caerostris darwini TaxID=1538125 RepID=A0AAV4PGV2_9ARAC|nr:hypothetical protein CDAR_459261 [Caerostris darwini]
MCLFVFVEEADSAATNSVLSKLRGRRDVWEWMEQAGSRDCGTEFVWMGETDFAATNSVLSELQGWREVLEWMEQAGSRDCRKEFVWRAEMTA